MDFAGMIQTWIGVLTGPGEATFEREQESPNATLSTALIWVVLAAVITGVLGFIQSLMFASSARGMMSFVEQMNLPPESAAMIRQMMAGGLFAGLGGASADAAATFRGLNLLHGSPLREAVIYHAAGEIGAAIPFLLYGGSALAWGRRDRLGPVVALPPRPIGSCSPRVPSLWGGAAGALARQPAIKDFLGARFADVGRDQFTDTLQSAFLAGGRRIKHDAFGRKYVVDAHSAISCNTFSVA